MGADDAGTLPVYLARHRAELRDLLHPTNRNDRRSDR